jgi:hypothetical protein
MFDYERVLEGERFWRDLREDIGAVVIDPFVEVVEFLSSFIGADKWEVADGSIRFRMECGSELATLAEDSVQSHKYTLRYRDGSEVSVRAPSLSAATFRLEKDMGRKQYSGEI